MTRLLKSQHRHARIALAALALVASVPALGRSPTVDKSLEGMLDMAAREAPYQRVADAFIAAAAAGDAAKAARLISPTTAAKAGSEGVDRYLTGTVLPFFGQFKQVADSVTVTRIAQATGFAFYMYMVPKAGELRPFVIYVIEEGGTQVVANILVDHFVAERHCTRVAGGWQCPDFGQ